jgi:hypothetical protein
MENQKIAQTGRFFICGPSGIRTLDPLLANSSQREMSNASQKKETLD